MIALQHELEVYKKALPSLLADEGKFALVFGDEIIGVYESYADAIQSGYKTAGIKPFLVKKIMSDEALSYFSRDINFACPA